MNSSNQTEILVDCGPITDYTIDPKYTGTRFITQEGKWIIPAPPPKTTWRSQSIEQTNQILNTGQNMNVKEITTVSDTTKEKYENQYRNQYKNGELIVYGMIVVYFIYLWYYLMKKK
jgi:hypothetical protein